MNIVERLRKNKNFCANIGTREYSHRTFYVVKLKNLNKIAIRLKALAVNLGALCVGLAIGWPRPTFTYMYEPTKAETEPMLLFVDQAWVESMINVGASLGSLGSILISDFYGRRISFSLSAAILVAFWIFLGISGLDKLLIISAAVVAGLGVGMFSATTVLYVAEISTLESRGIVGTTVMLFGCLGIFVINLLGYFGDISIVLSAMAAPALCFLASVYFFIIESPFYLFQKGAVLQAKISLKNLRDRQCVLDIDQEYKSMEAFFNVSLAKGTRQKLLESLCPKSLQPLGLIAAPMLCISQMLGVEALSDYAEQLIESISPYTGGLLTSFIDLVSTVLCIFLIERFGRKPLLIFTILGSGLCCLVLSVYHLTQEQQCFDQKLLKERKILPTVMLCIYYGIYALGLIPVLPIVTGEIFPCRAKSAAVGICTSLLYFTAFCMQRSYQALNQYTSSCFAFACFAMLGSIGLPLVVAFLPETKGKSLLQIQTEMENGVVVNY